MRFTELQLLRYGCFTDRVLEFRRAAPDLQLIYGPNEAGKSTALAAVGDLLFGFPKSTPYAFQHDYADLRIGAVLDSGAASLAFRRRKGIRDTLLDLAEQPLPDSALAVFLGNTDRAFFERMFSLDHQRLREGGRAILDAKDEVGRTLFAAGAGIASLGEELKRIEAEADSLWAPRKSEKRLYYQRLAEYKESTRRLQEATVPARAWKQARAALDEIEREHAEASREYREKSARRERLERIRRVLGHVGERRRLLAGIEQLAGVPELPADAAAILAQAEIDRAAAGSKIESIERQIAATARQLEALKPDETLLARQRDIEELDAGRGLISKHHSDLPKRLAEVETNKEQLIALVREIGWQAETMDDAAKLLPPRTKLTLLRGLIERKVAIDERRRAAERNALQHRDELTTIEERIAKLGEIPDTTELTAAIRHVRARGDLQASIQAAQQAADGAAEKLQAVRDGVSDAASLLASGVPEATAVEQFAERFQDLEARLDENRRETETADRDLATQRLDREHVIRDEHAVPRETLEQARSHRDLGWNLIRRQYIEQQSLDSESLDGFGAPDDLPGAFERSVQETDDLADRRFEGAEAAARLAGIDRAIERIELRHRLLSEQRAALEAERAELEREWKQHWSASGIDPSEPAAMLTWLEHRDAAVSLATERSEHETKLARLAEEESEATETLLAAMSRCGAGRDNLTAKPLALLVEEADALRARLAEQTTRRRELLNQLGGAMEQRKADERDLEESREALERWAGEFQDAVRAVSLDPALTSDEVRAALDIISDIGALVEKIRETQTGRIDTMRRDIGDYRRRVAAIVADVAPELSDLDPSAAVLELKRRLAAETSRLTERRTLLAELDRRRKELDQENDKRREALARVGPLLDAAGAADWPALEAVIPRADRRRELQEALATTVNTLRAQGDGKTPEELEQECAGADPDALKGELDALAQELDEINNRLQEIAARRRDAQAALDAISGRPDAAAAAADRQQALAAMGEAVDRYIRVSTAAKLLRWAIERYRKEKQAPLLGRAGEHFRTLTLGEFQALTVAFDASDKTHLVGLRQSGDRVGVDAMSDGTVDQLYLALRIAAVEDYLEKGVALPFIADDLFINYDDDRAAAGFELLAEFARRTQVLFFTHHRHLVDIATGELPSLPPPVPIVQ